MSALTEAGHKTVEYLALLRRATLQEDVYMRTGEYVKEYCMFVCVVL